MKHLYMISLYYRRDVVTGANKRFDEQGERLARKLGPKNFKVIVSEGEKPYWCNNANVVFMPKYGGFLGRFNSNLKLSNYLLRAESGVVLSDFMPLPFWGLSKHAHFQLIHDLRSFTPFSRGNVGQFTSLFQRRALRNSGHVVTVSQFTKNELVDLCGLDDEKVVVSYNGVDQSRYVASDTSFRAIDFLYVATFESRKNHEFLLSALKEVSQPAKVVLVGRDLGLKPHIECLAAQIMSDNPHVSIRFIESVTDGELIGLYNDAKNFISPSLLEGFGMPLIEAALCGCRIICSDLPVFKEILGGCAKYFDPYDRVGLTSLMESVLNDGHSVDSKCLEFIAQRFGWDSIVDNLMADLDLRH